MTPIVDPNDEFHQDLRGLSQMEREDGFLDNELTIHCAASEWRTDAPPIDPTIFVAEVGYAYYILQCRPHPTLEGEHVYGSANGEIVHGHIQRWAEINL